MHTPLEIAAGKLISAIQKEWNAEIGDPSSVESERVLHSSHDLLQAARSGMLANVLHGSSIADFIGADWMRRHSTVVPFIRTLENTAKA